MQTYKIIYIFLFLFFSCDKLPRATGANNEITIVTSNEDVDFVKLYVKQLFEKSIYTPIEENLYDINIINASSFNSNKYKKNIIIVSLENPMDKDVDLLSKKIIKQYDNSGILSMYDLYASNQIILNIYSHDSNKLGIDMNINKEWIYDEVVKNIEKNYLYDIDMRNKNKDIQSLLNEKFGLDMLIDENYKLIKNSDNFIWIGRGYPYRWIIFSQLDKKNLGDYDFKNRFIKFVDENIDGVNISEYMLKTEGDIIRGLYEHDKSGTGGPFFTYKYRNINKDKLIFVSGFVNNPGKKKAYLLLQLETIIKNIKGVYEQ